MQETGFTLPRGKHCCHDLHTPYSPFILQHNGRKSKHKKRLSHTVLLIGCEDWFFF
jgi:hypothetical protein